MAIERLSIIDRVTASTYFAVNANNQDYRASAGTVADFVNGLVASLSTIPPTIQYASPAADFSFDLTNNGVSTWLVITPVNIIANGTIVLPEVNLASDGQEVLVITTQAINSLTIDANGASAVAAPSSLAANDCFKLKFEPILKRWYRVESQAPTSATATIQYTSPTTSFTFTLANNSVNTWLSITPTVPISSGAIVLPAATIASQGQEILVTSSQRIDSFSINANGGSVSNVPTSIVAGGSFKLKFEPNTKVWYVVQSNQSNFGTY